MFGNSAFIKKCFLLYCAIAVLLGSEPSARAAVDLVTPHARTAKYLQGLRERQLFGLVNAYCRKALADSELPAERRVPLLLAWSDSLAEQARLVPPSESEGIWQQAETILIDGQRLLVPPYKLLLSAQQARVYLRRGEFLLEQARLSADPLPGQRAARPLLLKAVQHAQQLVNEITEQAREARMRPRDPSPFNQQEWYSLETHTQWQLAQALRTLAESHPADSADRADALLQATAISRELTERDQRDTLYWQAALEMARCARLAGKVTEAKHWIQTAQTAENLNPELQQAWSIEAVRLSLAIFPPEQVAVSEPRFPSPETTVLRLEAALKAWQDADRKQDEAGAERFRALSTQLAKQATQAGLYWGRRAGVLQARYYSDSKEIENLTVLEQAAESFYRAGKIEDALATYDRAMALAEKLQTPEDHFRLGLVAAQIQTKEGNHPAAEERYRLLETSHPTAEQAPQASLMALWHLSQLVRSGEVQLDTYQQRLVAHLDRYPTAPASDQVRWWLATLLDSQQECEAAAEHYSAIRPDGAYHAQAITGLDRVVQHLLNAPSLPPQERQEKTMAAALQFEQMILTPQRTWPLRWSPSQRQAALRAGQLWLRPSLQQAARAEQVFQAAFSDTEFASETWKRDAHLWLAISLALQNRLEEAETSLQQALEIEEQLPLTLMQLDRVSILAEAAPAEQKLFLAKLLEEALRFDLSTPTEPRRQAQTQRIQAKAFLLQGKEAEAKTLYHTLVKENPKDAQLLQDYAELLSESDSPADWEAAIPLWRRLERGSKAGTDRWFEAKFFLARTYLKQGDKERARELLFVLKTLYPDFGGETQRAKFQSLLDAVNQ
ncbi:Hypothetical protein PBC10988_32120 [Planctomycetales bacterium 10988]|nr:Hypothetical protein PBC10988_32120 [Planctomycetales bacterium 10988]